ncbi:hypothetical protein EEQ60_06100 [Escherichia coli]|uniref:Uncharacterized protein n=3 Tax=Escherichia coli TaxID=562 RepID=A0A3L5H0Q5_ECOLX|nr:hypothetical protein [Escherichia coli]EEW8995073.1 hypothetical protein [Escherichia coli]MIB61124.1 hypothetical protein [Escherichia coli]OYL41896.1 hypothetical protein CI770_12550 [Shigella sonnei]PIM08919.1 hypothetical protein CT145_11505 [Escherichia coli]
MGDNPATMQCNTRATARLRNSVFTAVLTFDLGMKAFIVLTPFCNSIVLRAFHRCCTRYMAQLCH